MVATFVAVFGVVYVVLPAYRLVEYLVIAYLLVVFFVRLYRTGKK